jgi:tetratricopeptide (TPR) repeat protein
MREALEALNLGDLSLANSILSQVSKSWQERMSDPQHQAAVAEFELGKIAERQLRWYEACDHYRNAANWESDNPEYQMKLSCACVKIGRMNDALVYATQAFTIATRTRSITTNTRINLLYDLAYIKSNAGHSIIEINQLLQECTGLSREIYGSDSAQYRYFLGRRAACLSGKTLEQRKP